MINGADILKVAEALNKEMIQWRSVACAVNLTSQELDDIVTLLLKRLIEIFGSAATYTELCDARIECRFGIHVTIILAIAKIRYVCCSVLDFM